MEKKIKKYHPLPPLPRDKQIRLNKLERVSTNCYCNHRELLKITGADFDISLHKD